MKETDAYSEMKAVRVLIAGRVQGVGFRVWTERNARALRLGGWVRNRGDGTVEALFTGAADRIGEMVKRCHSGPGGAVVSGVSVVEEPRAPAESFLMLPSL